MERHIKKPWGSEEILEANPSYVVKLIKIKKGKKLSEQYHIYKHETIYVLKGDLELFIKEPSSLDPIGITHELKVGDSFVIPNRTIHRFIATKDCILLECSTPELWDVVRLEDDYGRS